jgi:hypothetical protein
VRCLVLPIVLMLAAPVQAAPPPKRPTLSQVLKGQALERYETARQDFKASRFQQALAGFADAHALAGDPRLLWNAAACQRKLERNAEALRSIDRYLEAGAQLSAEELEEARRAQVAVRALVAIVRITTTPPDAAISLDGSPLEGAATAGIYVEPGRHAFHFAKAGHEALLRQEGLKAGEVVSWSIDLAVIAAPVAAASMAPTEVKQPAPAPAPVRWAPWVVVGTGAIAAGVGGLFLGLAAEDFLRFRGECRTICPPERWAASRDLEVAGVVLLSTGLAAIGAGIAWWALGGEPRARVSLGPGRISFEVRF